MAAWWKHVAGTLIAWGPHGLFVLAIFDSAGLPIVGGVDALLIAVSVNQPHRAFLAALWAILGSLCGSLILFGIARKGGEVLLSKHIASRTGARLHRWFERYGLVTVFIPAVSPLPLPMKVPVFCAGALEVRWSYFISVVSAARAIRYFALAYLALHYGHSTFQFLESHLLAVGSIGLGLAIAAILALQIAEHYDPEQGKSTMTEK